MKAVWHKEKFDGGRQIGLSCFLPCCNLRSALRFKSGRYKEPESKEFLLRRTVEIARQRGLSPKKYEI